MLGSEPARPGAAVQGAVAWRYKLSHIRGRDMDHGLEEVFLARLPSSGATAIQRPVRTHPPPSNNAVRANRDLILIELHDRIRRNWPLDCTSVRSTGWSWRIVNKQSGFAQKLGHIDGS